VILIHRLEVRRRIATAACRISPWKFRVDDGYDYSKNQRLTDIVKDPGNYPVILYPGQNL